MNNGIPSKFIIPQNVSWDFAVAARVTEIPEKPNENNITIPMIGIIIKGFGKVTPIAKAIPIIKLACKAAIKEMADIFPIAIAEREIGDVKALFIKPYRLSHSVFTPPKILVKIAVKIITPGAINSIYSPSNPTD
jgi:hypothetical protein